MNANKMDKTESIEPRKRQTKKSSKPKSPKIKNERVQRTNVSEDRGSIDSRSSIDHDGNKENLDNKTKKYQIHNGKLIDHKINAINYGEFPSENLKTKLTPNVCEKIGRNLPITEEHNQNNPDENQNENENFVINMKFDLVALVLFIVGLFTRFYRLATPNNIVFDEMHYGKYVSMYMKNTFFFDQHPPLGKQLIAVIANLVGYDGNFNFPRIGSPYSLNVPIFWLRFVPALCGSLLPVTAYKLLQEAGLNRWTALLGGILVILDNSLLTQSRFVLLESMLMFFSSIGLLFLLRFQKTKFGTPKWILFGIISSTFFTFALTVKYVGFMSCCLGFFLMCRYLWKLLYDSRISNFQIFLQTVTRGLIFIIIPIGIYIGVFYVHLLVLNKAGPHDSIMTSAFQASLEGGLASITKGQPVNVVHGSQITLRNTHGRPCWLHSHEHLYPVRYKDKRGSSHQQQVTCYSFKDVNNWWIVKRPERDDLVVGDDPEIIRDGDVIQLVHGITSRALNSHDVAAPVTPKAQEVSCYIDHHISMPAELLWKVKILNKDTEGPIWHAIRSEIQLIHESTNTVLRFTKGQLPEWGFNQHEVVSDKIHDQKDAIWNVEEHRYTKTEDQKERERDMLRAEMIPTRRIELSFWNKFLELQTKMLWYSEQLQGHMYSSDPLEWPLMDKGIAYWVDIKSNGQIHLIGNICIWYAGTLAICVYIGLLVFYLIRRQRKLYDLQQRQWEKFQEAGEIFLAGYLIHYVPYFFVDRVLFLHNYLPAFIYKLFLLCYVVEHLSFILQTITKNRWFLKLYKAVITLWIFGVFYVFWTFLAISYGIQKLTADEVIKLRWKDTWDLILHKDLP